MKREFFIIVSIVCAAVIFSLRAHAQEAKEQARLYYERGKRLYEQGKYKEAQEAFEKAIGEKTSQKKEKVLPKAEETPQETQQALKTQEYEYVIGDEDALFISVWQNKDLDQDVVVRPDGKVSFPLIGDVQASGLTISQLDEALTKSLSEYIRHPDVSIMVRKLGGKKIIVLGEVAAPGVRLVTGKKTVLEAIASSGGFSPHAVISSVILIRGGFSNAKGMRLNLERAIRKADMSQNIALEPEDIVYVPKKFIANVNYFVTQIIGPLVQGMSTAEKLSTFGQAPTVQVK